LEQRVVKYQCCTILILVVVMATMLMYYTGVIRFDNC
jgi:hypothetical protein